MAVKNVTFEVSADTSKAQASLNALIQQLATIQKNATISLGGSTQQLNNEIKNVSKSFDDLSKATKTSNQNIKQSATENASAYKKVVDAAKELTSKARELGAQLLLLEQSGQKNTSAYQKLNSEYRKLKIDADKANASVKDLNKSLTNQPKVQFKTNANQAKREVGGITGSVNAVSQAVANSSTNFVRLRNVIARTGLALSGVAIGAAVTSLGRAAIKAASDYEVLRVAFTTFIGNAALAEVKIRQLRQFAAETPFTVDEVFKASRTLLGYGVAANELIPIIKRLGDVAGGTGAPLERIALVFGQVRAAGRLYGQDLLQLINAGFNPLQEISRTTGKSFGQLKDEMRKGLVTFDDVNNAFITATSEGGKFFNLTNALANTTQGRLARLSESWTELLRVLGDGLLPTFNAVVVSATKVVAGLKELPEVIEKNKVSILLLTAATALFVGMRTKANQSVILATVLTAADNVVERVSNTLYRIKAVLLANTTRATVGMTIAQRAQTVATNIATVSQNAFNAAVSANPLGLILTLLALATAAWYAYGDAVGGAAQDWIDLNDVTSKADAQANKAATERINLVNQEINAIKATKTGTKERQDLIDKFNEKNKPATKIKDIADEKLFVNALDAAYGQLSETIKRQELSIALTEGKGNLEAQKTTQIENVLKEARNLKVEIPIELLTRPSDIEGKLQGAKDLVLNEQKAINDEIKRIQALSEEEIIAQANELRAKGVRVTQTQTSKEGFTTEADVTALENQAAAITNKVIPAIEVLNDTYTNIAGVQIELNPLDTVLQYDPSADDAKAEAEKKRLQQYLDYLNEYYSLLDRIRKNNEDFRKQSIEFQFIDAANFEEEVAKLKLLDKINEETINRQIDREIDSVRLKDLTEQQKNDLITQLETIRGQEQQARAFDLQNRIYEIERDGTLARRKLALQLNDLYNDIASDRLKKELDSLDELRNGFEDFYNDIFEDNPFAKGRFIKSPLFGNFGFQFEDVEADIEGLKRGLQQITQFSPGDLFDDTTQGARLELIDEFNKKYGTTIKLTEDELGLQQELSKAYSDIQKQQEALTASQKKVGIFRFAKQIIEEGANDPFKLALEDSQREYFTKLDEDFNQTKKGLTDARNAAATEYRTLYEGNLIEKADADAQLKLLDTKLQEDIKKAEDETDAAKKARIDADIEANKQRVEQLRDIIKEERDARIQALEDIKDAFLDFQKVFIDGQIQQTEAAISAQEKRVQAAKEIADKGNVVLLKAEQERLDKLNRQRASFVRQQQNLAAVEIAVNAAIAVAKAAGQPGAPLTIFAILAAMGVGFAQARAQAQSAATFAKGGYTGDGHQFQEAGTVHKGEFVMNAQKTRQYRPLLEAIHAGRNPKSLQTVQDRMLVVNSKSTDERLERIEKAIMGQKGLQLSIDENGINGIVSRISYKQQRINNRAR